TNPSGGDLPSPSGFQDHDLLKESQLLRHSPTPGFHTERLARRGGLQTLPADGALSDGTSADLIEFQAVVQQGCRPGGEAQVEPRLPDLAPMQATEGVDVSTWGVVKQRDTCDHPEPMIDARGIGDEQRLTGPATAEA